MVGEMKKVSDYKVKYMNQNRLWYWHVVIDGRTLLQGTKGHKLKSQAEEDFKKTKIMLVSGMKRDLMILDETK